MSSKFYNSFGTNLRKMKGIYSDEASLQNSANTPNPWVWRLPSQKWDEDKVNTQDHVKPTIKLMIWGAIWKGGRSELVVMQRDESTAAHSYTSWSYIEALKKGLLPNYTPGRFFQQDNARIHVSQASKDFLERHGIWVIDWPAHSPDMNPIEHVWKKMKEILNRDFPELSNLGRNQGSIEVFIAALKAAWDRVP